MKPTENLRIGILLGSKKIGGMERQAAYLCQHLLQKGIHVTLFLMQGKNDFTHEKTINFGQTQIIYLGVRRYNHWAKKIVLIRHIKRLKLDLLQMYNLEAIQLGNSALQHTNQCQGLAAVRGMKFIHNQTNAKEYRNNLTNTPVTCNSYAIRDALVAKVNINTDHICVIKNGIFLPDNIFTATMFPENRPTILFAGTLKTVKDPMTFVSAAIDVQNKLNCKIIIAGDGHLTDKIRKTLENNISVRNWSMLGEIPPEEVPYGDVNIVVSSSLREGGSNTILEAMAHSKPVIGTDVGATSSMINESKGGLLVPVQNVRAMSNAICKLLRNLPLQIELGQNGRSYIEQKYSTDHMVDKHILLYNKIVSDPKGLQQ